LKQSADTEKALYLLGWIGYREEQFDEAINRFQMVLDSYPSGSYRDESQYWIGWSYFRKKNYEKAIGEFERLVQQYPRSPLVPSSLLKMGDGYYNLKRYGQATNIYLHLIKEYPKSKEAPEADYGIILSLLQEKKREAFVARVESFVKRYPEHPLTDQALIQLGDFYQENRMNEKAEKTYRELIDLHPKGEGAGEAQFRIALLFKQERKWVESVEEMEKFIRQYPKSHLHVEAHVEAGELYLSLKDFAKALEKFDWVIRYHPQHLMVKRAYLGMEEGYRSLGRIDQAVKVTRDFIEKFREDEMKYEGYLRLGLLFMSQKKFGEAISAFSVGIQSPVEGVASQAHLKLGEAHLGAGNREQAVLQFSRVIYLYPHRPEVMEEALLKLGMVYLEEKKFTEAKQVYQKLLAKTKREDRRELARKMMDQIQRGMPYQ
jgi:tol-pal system protein YbgF